MDWDYLPEVKEPAHPGTIPGFNFCKSSYWTRAQLGIHHWCIKKINMIGNQDQRSTRRYFG